MEMDQEIERVLEKDFIGQLILFLYLKKSIIKHYLVILI